MKLDPNTLISHYRVLSKIGEGGMGEVYLAEDTKLGRKVAIKFLSDEFKGDKEKLDRFIQEAKAASALNHPNIITVFEIGAADGVDFIATEFIDGKDLNRILAERSLTVEESLDIGIQAASALRAAHEAGIIHRDIKSDNVMVRSDGIVKVLDFGLAKLTQKTDSAETNLENDTIARVQTQPGIVMGTPNYMSPEQVRGRGIDHRTDIFSLGVLLYEMIARTRPFEGGTTSDVMAAVLTKMPVPLSNVIRTIPAEIDEIVSRALEKEKEKRFQSAAELLKDLTEAKQDLQIRARLKTTEPAEREPTQIFEQRATVETGSFSSIAVLPFTNMSADEENEYFCDGLAEELLGTLSKIGDLKVAARSTSFAFKGSGKSAKEIGDALGVQAILDGSVRKSGSRVRIAIQLVDASNGYQLWSERFDREMRDIFEVQDEIALSVADALKLQLLGEEREAVLKRYTNNAEAYQLYLRGRFFFYKRTPEGFRKAIGYFERAIALDPEYAIAYSGLADCWVFLGFYEAAAPSDAEAALTPLVEKALELDDSLAETLVSSAIKKALYDWDFDGSLTEYRRAIEINPRYAFAHHLESTTLALLGLGDEAAAAESRACELEPFTAIFNAAKAWWYYFSDKLDKAIDQSLKTIEIAPNHFFAHWVLGLSYARQGKFPEGLAALSNAKSLTDGSPHIVADIARVHAMSGKRDEALRILADLERESAEKYISAVNFARVHAGLGNRDKVLDYIEKAASEEAIKLPFVLIDPMLEDFWSEPRFRAIVKKVGVKPCYPVSVDTDRSLEAPTIVIQSDTSEEETGQAPPAVKRRVPYLWIVAGILAVLTAIAAGYFGYGLFASNDRAIDSIAVMPFVNEGGDSEVEYLSDGMTETLISSLSKLPNLDVKPRSTVFRYKGKQTEPNTVAAELNVQAILNGKVTQRGNEISLFVELIDVALDKVVWSQQYSRKQNDLVDLQAEIARDVSSRLKPKISETEETSITRTYTANSEAYQLYLKGNFHKSKYTEDGLKKGIEFFEQAIAVDPNYALAYHGIAGAYDFANGFYMPPRDSAPKAKAAAMKALEIDDSLAETHFLLGKILFWYDWDFPAAEKEWKRANELDPSYPPHYPIYLAAIGRHEEAIRMQEALLRKSPLDLNMIIDMAGIMRAAGKTDEAIAQCRKALELDPEFWWAYQQLGLAYLQKKEYRAAMQALEKARSADSNALNLAHLGYAYAVAGRKADAEKALEDLTEMAKDQYVSHFSYALIYAGLGEKDKAFEWLERSFQERDHNMTLLMFDPVLANLSSDPRFADLLNRMNLPR